MFSIGDFARHGRVSVRMLRHYDAIGLLRPAQVEARLRTIDEEGQMPADDVVLKSVPAARVVELTGVAASFRPKDIGPIVHPLCAELGRRLADAAVTPGGRLTCYYEEQESGEVVVHAAVPIAGQDGDPNGLTVADLPAAENVATIVHRGSMDAVLPAWQTLARWIDANGYRSSGLPRELYLEVSDNPDEWVTELQEPIIPA